MAIDTARTATRRSPGRRGARALPLLAGLLLVAGGCSDAGTDDAAGNGSRSTTTAATTTTTTTPAALAAPEHPWVVAHRGSSARAPENTLAAFDRAVEDEAEYIELDLQLTADGTLVVLHDTTLDRTARGPAEDCSGPVDAKTLAQVQTCDAGTWFNEEHPDRAEAAFADQRIPSFDEVLARYGTEVRWYLEIKALAGRTGMEAALVASLEAAGFTVGAPATSQLIVQSFDAETLRVVAELRPDLAVTQLLGLSAPRDDAAFDEIATYASGIAPGWPLVDEALLAAAHERCLTVVPYTVDDPTQMSRLLDLGVDGVITNHPDVLRPLVMDRPLVDSCPEG